MASSFHGRSFHAVVLLLAAFSVSACGSDSELPGPPSPSQVAAYYDYTGEISVEMSGNVAQVIVRIDRDDFRAGGEVWAKASPYIFLFSPGTRQAFADHPGLGGVRVIVRYGDGTLVAQALLERGELTEGAWTRALNVAGQARTQGSERPGFMRDLVRWGEDHTTFQYNPDYISTAPSP
jgi:hypothetical protein